MFDKILDKDEENERVSFKLVRQFQERANLKNEIITIKHFNKFKKNAK